MVTVVTVGISEYTGNKRWNFAEASTSRERVEQVFVKHGADPEDWTPVATTEKIRDELDGWSSRVEDSHVVYWTGHGECSDDGYRAALADSPDPLSPLRSLTNDDLYAALLQWTRLRDVNGQPSWLLLILDTCGSVSGAWRIDRAFDVPPRNVVIVGGSDGAGFAGSLANALDSVLDGFTGNDAQIQLRELARRLADLLDVDGARHVHGSFDQTLYLAKREDTPPPTQAPVDVYRELRVLFDAADPHVRNHFFAKAQGAEIGELTWYFAGRERERSEIAEWLRDADSGMFVVSGLAGSGKSALLGMVLATSDEAFVDALVQSGYPRTDPRLCAFGVAFDAVLHLSGRTVTEVTSALSSALGLETRDDINGLIIELHGRQGRTLTLLADALDESRDPLTVAATLRRLAALPGVRILLGTRQSLHEYPDHPIPRDRTLLDALAAPREITLQRDTAAVQEYVTQRLGNGLGDHSDPLVDQHRVKWLARLIASYDQPFLFARLAVAEIVADPTLADDPMALRLMLDAGHRGIFGHAVMRLRETAPRCETLLHALTYSRGNGFPRTGGIWQLAASALSDEKLDDTDVERTLTLAAPFIMQDSEFGHTAYRLAHRTFAEWYLREDPDGAQVEKTMFEALIESLGQRGCRNWSEAHPYLSTYLADHALAAGVEELAVLTEDAGFVCGANPLTLMPALAAALPADSDLVRVYRRALPQLGLSSAANAAYLEEASLALDVARLNLSETGIKPMYQPRWAHVRADQSLMTLVGHEGRVNAVAIGSISGGSLVLASGGYDTKIRLWNPGTGMLTHDPLVGHRTQVLSLAIAPVAGQLLLVSGGAEGDIRLWNALAGQSWDPETLQGPRVAVRSVALCPLPHGRLLMASGGADGTIRLWNPLDGTLIGPMNPPSGSVRHIDLTGQGYGRPPLLISAEDDGTVRLWNAKTRKTQGPALLRSADRVEAVAFGMGPSNRIMAACAESNGAITIWDLGGRSGGWRPGRPLRPCATCRHGDNQPGQEHAEALALSFGVAPSGRLVLVSAGSDRIIRCWDPETGRSQSRLVGHGGKVLSVATARPKPETMFIASADADGTVRFWHPRLSRRNATRAAGPARPAGELGSITSLAFSPAGSAPPMLASGGSDSSVRLWDPASGRPLGKPMWGGSRHVLSVAFGWANKDQLLLASASHDGVRVWDAVTQSEAAERWQPPADAGRPVSLALGRLSDGRSLLAVGTTVGTVHLLNPLTGRALADPIIDESRTALVAIGRLPGGRVVLAVAGRTPAREGRVRVIDIEHRLAGEDDLAGVEFLSAQYGGVCSLNFDSLNDEPSLLAFGGTDGSVYLWDATSEEPRCVPLTGHRRAVRSVACGRTRSEQLVASTARDGKVQVWDKARSRWFMTIRRRVPAQAVALNGARLAIGDNEGLTLIDLE